ncbi:HNH endonuclease [uncultured Pseudokineococcus sp.]|uniref:HNH endonuclease n=1 Tax=uncultured Pseudokineococcus sp. TaxID=1642928 RepID=UPI00261387C7|nr:HNH endonuclease [uncultured Pseudokineococcus sp.]
MDSVVERVTRERAMAWVEQRAAENGGWISRDQLLRGFCPDGAEPLGLIDYSRGIRNPAHMAATLSITTSVGGPYEDRELGDGLLHYAYRQGGRGGDNTKLRRAMELGVPLILFIKTEPNVLVPVQPVYVVADDESTQTFVIALDEDFRDIEDPTSLTEEQRRYAVRTARQRLHQPVFRGRVIRAYATRCSICSLAHGRLLEAAHIYPDSHPEGRAVVSNGLSLCSIHHAAYDANLLGITPDHVVQLDDELLTEVDGPMLRHGLQEMHGRALTLPARRQDRPDRDALAFRYEAFRR